MTEEDPKSSVTEQDDGEVGNQLYISFKPLTASYTLNLSVSLRE